MEKMLRFAALAILCAAVCAVSVIGEPNSADFGVDVVESIDKYLAQNPEIEFLHEMDGKFMDDRQQFRYSHGRRLQGDRLVANNNLNQQYQKPQDVTVRLKYPKSGVGANVTFVHVVVDQSSNQGRAFVVSGGIGQRQFSAVIIANQTTFFRYNAQVYGHND